MRPTAKIAVNVNIKTPPDINDVQSPKTPQTDSAAHGDTTRVSRECEHLYPARLAIEYGVRRVHCFSRSAPISPRE
jgi:hypothetical protein